MQKGPSLLSRCWVAGAAVAILLTATASSYAESCQVPERGAKKCSHGKPYVCDCGFHTGKVICEWYPAAGGGCR